MNLRASFLVLMAASLATAFAACGNDDPASPPDPENDGGLTTDSGAGRDATIASDGAANADATIQDSTVDSTTDPDAQPGSDADTDAQVGIDGSADGGVDASDSAQCVPSGSTDDPDDSFADTNCDGVDGDATKAIFVATTGANGASCGLVRTDPCLTVSFGIARANSASRSHVYVQAGTYNGVVRLMSGIHVFGGYDVNWVRGDFANAANRVLLKGAKDATENEFVTVLAHTLAAPTTMDNLEIEGPNANELGKSSYGIHAEAANLSLRHVKIVGGAGANGTPGAPGTDAITVVAAPSGGNGADGSEPDASACSTFRVDGGVPSTNSCAQSPSARVMTGGAGGRGGSMDSDCNSLPPNLTARAGLPGENAPIIVDGGAAGLGGDGGIANANNCNNGQGSAGGGNRGAITNGPLGGAGSGGSIVSSYWYAKGGADGGTGENGGGGGGGGGAGGCDDGLDGRGPGGGAGGAGGCAARAGGGGGGGGGGSFGIFAVSNSTITLTACTVVRGAAGTGGAGGPGGRGQPGGAGGLAGANSGTSPGGGGGAGGHGGHGGGGGGGAGGRSVAIARTPDSTLTTSNVSMSGGAAGAGGAGGVSAPTVQGTSDDDGAHGTAGVSGTVNDVLVCASAVSC